MAMHEFNPTSELIHFNYLLEEQTQLLQSTTSLQGDHLKQTAKKQALIIFNTISFPENVRSIVHEESKRKDEVLGAWHIKDGQVYAEGYGTPETLFERTRTHFPELYKEEEAQTALKGFKLLASGEAEEVGYAMFHPDGNRYIARLRRVGDEIINVSVDVGKFGRDLTQTEGGDVIRLLHDRHKQNTEVLDEGNEFPLLVVKNQAHTISTQEVQQVAISRSLISDVDHSKKTVSVFVPSQQSESVQEMPYEQEKVLIGKTERHTVEPKNHPDHIRSLIQNSEALSRKALKDTRETLVAAGVVILDTLRRKRQEKKGETKQLSPVKKKESLVVRAWHKLLEKPKALVLLRKESRKRGIQEKRARIVTEKLAQAFEKTADIVRRPKQAIERIVTQIKILPEQVKRDYKKATVLVAKKIEFFLKRPIVYVEDKISSNIHKLRKKTARVSRAGAEFVMISKTKTQERIVSIARFIASKLFPMELRKDQKQTFVQNVRLFNRPQRLFRSLFANTRRTEERAEVKPARKFKKDLKEQVVYQIRKRFVLPVKSLQKQLTILFRKIVALGSPQQVAVEYSQVFKISSHAKHEPRYFSIAYWWVWLRWLVLGSELKRERPQGVAFGQPRSAPIKRSVNHTIFIRKTSRKQGSVTVV